MKLHPAPGSTLDRSPDDQPGPSRAVVARPLAAATIGSLYPRDYALFYLWLRTSAVGLTVRVVVSRGFWCSGLSGAGLVVFRRVKSAPESGAERRGVTPLRPR